ncbi:hypothetical protein [Nitrospira sp. Ecomares 2.1]
MAATPKSSSKGKNVGAANKAKVEFQEYKKRIEHAPAAEHGGPQFGTGATGMPQMPMGWPFPPMTGFMPQIPHLNPALGQTVSETSGEIADRVGETLKLGMDLLNSGLGVGLRFLQGLAGTEYHHGDAGWGHAHGAGNSSHGSHGYGCQMTCGCDCADCCQHSGCASSCCCSPSVGSCC